MGWSTLQAFLTLSVLVVTSSGAALYDVVDLTYELKDGSIGWPVHPPYSFTIVQRGYNEELDVYLEYNKFNTGEHIGTHADAPSHFIKGHWRSQEIPASHLIGPGVVLDISAKAAANPVYMMTMDDVRAWEEEHGMIPENAIVLVNSGWGVRYPDARQVFNTKDISNTSTFRFPTVSAEVGDFLVDERNILALGVDTPTPDLGVNLKYPIHVKLLGKDILILENVANVDKLPPNGTTIVIGMIKLHDGSGGPSRIMAIKGGAPGTAGCGRTELSIVTVALSVLVAVFRI